MVKSTPSGGQNECRTPAIIIVVVQVGTLLIIAVIFFLIWVYYTSTLEPWENKSAVRWTAIVGGLVFLLAAALVASVIAFEMAPRLD